MRAKIVRLHFEKMLDIEKDITITWVISKPVISASVAYGTKEDFREYAKKRMVGTSICHPEDKWDILLGMKLALKRSLELEWDSYGKDVYDGFRFYCYLIKTVGSSESTPLTRAIARYVFYNAFGGVSLKEVDAPEDMFI